MKTLRTLLLLAGLQSVTAMAGGVDLLTVFDLAREHDAAYRAARASTEATREALPQAKAQLLPNIAFSASRSRNDTEQTAPGTDRPGVDYMYTAQSHSLSVRQPLLRLQNYYRVAQAEAEVAGAEETLGSETHRMTLRAGTAYFGVLSAAERLRSQQAQIDYYRGQLTLAERSFTHGEGTRTDIEDARARHDMAVARAFDARNQLVVAERTLASVIGRALTAETLQPLDPARLNAPELTALPTWIERAEAINPEVAALRHALTAAEREVDRTRAAHYPTLDLVASSGLSRSETNSTIGNQYRTDSIGIQFSMPIYAGGGIDAMVRQALANRERAEYRLESARRELAVLVTREYSAATFGLERTQALQQALRSAQQAVIGSEKGVQAGTRNSVDVLNAQQQLFSVRAELAEARHEYVLAFLRLKAAAGELGEEDIRRVNGWLVPG